MRMYKTFTNFIILILICQSFVGVMSHNWLSNPPSRANQKATQTGCRVGGEGNPNCPGPCDKTVSQATIAPITVQRGQTLTINWNRHTHPGGFIRFAWSQTSQSDSQSSFDSHVDRIVCKEIGGCGPADPSDPSGTSNGIDCGTTITVPLYLTDGTWTLQWAYFGGWYNAGDYYACVDYKVSGGPTGTEQPAFFIGGDVSNPGTDVCLFYSTNALHVCVIEPCTTGTFAPGNQIGKPLGFSSNPPPSTPITTKKSTTSALTTSPKPLTTASKQIPPLTTASKQIPPLTTASKQNPPLTTASKHNPNPPLTTASNTPISLTTSAVQEPIPSSTTSAISSSNPNPGDIGCVLGNEVCYSQTTYISCYRATATSNAWSAPRPCQAGLVCKPWLDNNHVICDWPYS